MVLEMFKECRVYNVYVLMMLLVAYLLNQLDRYMLGITSKPMAQAIHFGSQVCMTNDSLPPYETEGVKCNATEQYMCANITNVNHTDVCKWDYNGQGLQYQIVAGPVFILVYTFMGIAVGFMADIYSRKVMLAIALIWWSAMTILTGFVQEYWQLVILRFGLGLGEAGCTPFAASIITDYFGESIRGVALGVYNWGIYLGYSMSYAFGNFITEANILGQGWRWSFYISGIPGILFGVLILLTVKEPERQSNKKQIQSAEVETVRQRFVSTLRAFMSPSLLLLCLAGSIRNASGYVWAYNTQPYFTDLGLTRDEIGTWMSWIPIVGGSLSVVTGGFIADRVVKKRGLYARVMIIVISLFLAAPFAAGTLFFSPPWAFVFQIPTYIIGEMWVPVTLAVLVELVPNKVRTSAVGFYFFIISNVGGNFPLLVPPLRKMFSASGLGKAAALRGALYILYPGTYVLGGFIFLLTMFVIKRDQRRNQEFTALSLKEMDNKM